MTANGSNTTMPTGRSIGCPGCPACVYPSKVPGYSHDQYDFRKCIIQIFWELTDSPSTLQKLKLGTKAQLRELLVASSQFAAEVGDVSVSNSLENPGSVLTFLFAGQVDHHIIGFFTTLPRDLETSY